ncbi:MAG: mitochondrial inner membrane protein required for protein import [Pleopsidium flavum]|nr:MAG: mitochondrial inner membrane protein required for protein import [Pleopsidium flavum]
MLCRAAIRALRVRGTSVPVQRFQWSRTFAKDGKPKRPRDYTPPPGTNAWSKPRLNAQRSSGVGATMNVGNTDSTSRGSDWSSNPDFSRDQVEFETNRSSRKDSVPQSHGAGPGVSEVAPTTTSAHPDYSKSQDEFQTSSASDANTAPQSSSPSAIDPAEIGSEEQAPSRPLPDLTQGIPLTLDAESADSSSSARPGVSNLNLTEDPAQYSAGGKSGGDLPKTAYISSVERRRNRLANYMYAGFLLFSITGTIYLGRNWETAVEERKHPDAPSGWGVGLFYDRAKARVADVLDYYNEPAFTKLLPDIDPAFERPYTLVLSLEDLLLHSEWTREHGWRMAKRPGLDYFLRYLSQYYELVIFTSVPSMIASPILQKLDPYGVVMWPLFREATWYKNGEYIKDLSYLGRDLDKVILIDTVPAHAKLQPENAIILPKWKGNPQDRELVSFIPFLEYVATMGFTDTRTVMKSFEGKHIPTEFAQREAIAREQFEKQLAEDRAKRPKRSGVGLLGSALGLKSYGAGIDGMEPTAAEGFERGKMLQDQIRERGQQQYEALEKRIREDGEKWLQEMAQEEEKAKEEQMKGMKASLSGLFGGAGK